MYRKQNGFTIMEMLVAIALTVVLLGILYNVFNNANQVARKTEGWIEIHQNARCLYDFMSRDFAGVVMVGRDTTNPSGRYFWVEGDDGGSNGTTNVFPYPDDSGVVHQRDAVMFFSRTAAVSGEIAEVLYFHKHYDDSDLRSDCVERYIDYATGAATEDLDPASSAWNSSEDQNVVAVGVTDLIIECGPGNGAEWEGFSGAWAKPHSMPPKRVRVTAYITDSKGLFLAYDTAMGASTDDSGAFPGCGRGLKFQWVFDVGAD